MKKNKITRKIDILNGTLLDKIIFFAIPIAISSVLQQLFNSADSAVIGQFVGSHALAAVGVNSPFISLFINFFAGCSVGINVIVSTYLGSHQFDRIKRIVGSSVAFSFIIGIIISVIGQFVSKPILQILGTPNEILDLACLYLKIYFMAMPFILLYNFVSAILRSSGDTQRPLFALFLAGIINVVLNVILVVYFNLSVAGVAIATLVSNAISSLLLLYWLLNEDGEIKLYRETIRLDFSSFSKTLTIGLPAGLQGAAFAISNICIQSAINNLGSDIIAGNTVALNFENFSYFLEAAFAASVVTFVSTNFAAGNYERSKKSTIYCLLGSVISYIVLGVLINVFADKLVLIFVREVNIIFQAKIRLRICVACLFLSSLYEILGGTLRGLGHSFIPAIVVLIGTCFFRLIWIYLLLPSNYKIEDIYIVYPITWCITSIVTTLFYFRIRKREYVENGAKQ